MSSVYIEELIRQGENTSIEFKRGDVRTENLAKELIAFSNSSGGVVLLGIEDNGEIQGLKNPRNYEEWISNLTRNNVIPPINVDYTESVCLPSRCCHHMRLSWFHQVPTQQT